MDVSKEPKSCLLCNKDLAEQKPLLFDRIPADQRSHIDEKLTHFRESFQCFLKLLNLDGEREVDEILNEVISVLWNAEVEVESSMEVENRSMFVGLPCCDGCCGALHEILRLQRVMDEIKVNQMECVEKLRNITFQAFNCELIGDNVWNGIRKQLVAGTSNRPLTSCSAQVMDSPPSTQSYSSSPPQPTEIRMPLVCEDVCQLSNARCSQRLQSNLPVSATPSLRTKPVMQPCSVVLERLPVPPQYQVHKKNEDAEESKRKEISTDSSSGMRKAKQKAYDFLQKNLIKMVGVGDKSCRKKLLNVFGHSTDKKSTRSKKYPGYKRNELRTPPQQKRRLIGFKPNHLIWKVTEEIVLYRYTLIQVYLGGTLFRCLEDGCSFSVQNIDYFLLFEKIKDHVDQAHFSQRSSNHQISCPHPDCQMDLDGGSNLRSHLAIVHLMDLVICEVCWKPIRNLADSYRRHKSSHKNEMEQLETKTMSPRTVLVVIGEKNNRRLSDNLEESEALEENQYEHPYSPIALQCTFAQVENSEENDKLGDNGSDKKSPGIKIPKLKKIKKNTSPLKQHRRAPSSAVDLKDEYFWQLKDNLLLYKYTTLLITPDQELLCMESGCFSTLVAKGTDYIALEKFKEHVNTCHINRNVKDYIKKSRQCPMCCEGESVFEKGPLWRRHLLRSEIHKRSPYICQSCLKPIKCRVNMGRHILTHQNVEGGEDSFKYNKLSSERKFICSDCGRDFTSSANLQSHKRTHVPKSLRNHFPCPHCPQMLLSKYAVRNHVERHHRPELQRFRYCPICNKKFNCREGHNFNVHLRIHKNEFPYVCEVCGKGFRASSHFRQHQKHAHSEQRSYQCEYCEMNYKFLKSLKRHRASAHRDKLPPEKTAEEKLKFMTYENRPDFIGPKIAFPCEFCEKVFPLRSRMKKHVNLVHAKNS